MFLYGGSTRFRHPLQLEVFIMAKRKWKLKKQDKLLQEMQAKEKLDFNLKLKDLVLPIGVLLLIGIIKVSCEAIPSMMGNSGRWSN